mmetsp:Transcript_57674/g.137197  ORF Transcript_57674/g.137197 Transcript_57674/m.137197 type:complete len:481 (-) Transcript_57674:115-1557(-)
MACQLVLVSIVASFLAAEALEASVASPGCACISHGQLKWNGGSPELDANISGTLVSYPTSYGNYCGKQPEPGAAECYDLTTGQELPASQQADWCNDPWCYVDPCTCPLGDLARSSYFPGTELYYSYSNCGGVDTFSDPANQNVDTGCATQYRPVDAAECALKMSNGQPRVDCTQVSYEKEFKCVMAKATGGSTLHLYPPTYGEGCGVHLEPGSPDCFGDDGNPLPDGQRADWCTKPWSYVNPCTCNANDMVRSTRFELELYYSYSVCGAEDTYTANPTDATISASVGCPSPAPPPVSPMNWHFTASLQDGCECIPLADEFLVQSTDASCEQGSGKCANSNAGMLTANYGGSCGIHAELVSSSCYDQESGNMWADQCENGWTVGCRAAWCDRPWCYVDPCTCESVQDIAASQNFPGSTLYYSYQNCKSVDTFTPDTSSVDLSGICSTSTASTGDDLSHATRSIALCWLTMAFVIIRGLTSA